MELLSDSTALAVQPGSVTVYTFSRGSRADTLRLKLERSRVASSCCEEETDSTDASRKGNPGEREGWTAYGNRRVFGVDVWNVYFFSQCSPLFILGPR